MFDKKEWQRQYRKAHPEKIKEENDRRKDYRKKRYDANRQARIDYSSKWNKEHPELAKEYGKRCFEKDPEKWRKYKRNFMKRRRWQRFGLTSEAAYEMLNNAEKCPICTREFTEKRPGRIDHDHDTNKARGVICNNCNRGLGLLGDSAENLRRAAEYLEHHARKEQSR